MMKNDADWKKHLLASDAALEFMVSRTLVEAGLSTNANMFTSGLKDDDRSIPIDGVGFAPLGNPNVITAEVSLHIDCQMRGDTARWLFFQDTNPPDFSEYTLGTTIRSIDEFSVSSLACNSTCEFEQSAILADHGVELGAASGDASGELIDKFLRRLQFSLPQLLTRCVNAAAYASVNPPLPFFICPILVTNSPLYVASSEISFESIQNSLKIEDIAEQVPYLVTRRSIDHIFEKHCAREFRENLQFDSEHLMQLESDKIKAGMRTGQAPSDIVESLIQGYKPLLDGYFSQYVVCNFEHLPLLLNDIKHVISSAMDDHEQKAIMNLR
ncbi:hypothetical protein [uncultured Idiomarina sp.]|uniref:hypothetical protein n=1 Tax=uncultured Idiomarina sp. TaxID=352961 RepID=UPI002598F38E|nr:hypothetical protein [uncultured Idiomarina sp.]